MGTPDTTPGRGGDTGITTEIPRLPVQSYDRETIWRGTHLLRGSDTSTPTQEEAEEVARQREEHASPQTLDEANGIRQRILDSERKLQHEPTVENPIPVDVRTIRVGPHS